MIVMKFGGTSVESPEAILQLTSIVHREVLRKPVVVVSAMGKTTNRLLAMAKAAVENANGYKGDLESLKRYHLDIVDQLGLKSLQDFVSDQFAELGQLLLGLSILGELSPRSIDAISSYGERLSSRVVAMALSEQGIPSEHIDARGIIVTDAKHTQAAVLIPETNKRLKKIVAKTAQSKVVVMGGFIASTLEGVTTTLGRGGSDYTAAIVGAGVDAEEIQIWTDVDGMMTTDPRLVHDAKKIKSISFSEAAELAFFGAKVLHPATVRPAIEKNIPVVVLNSRKHEAEGTRIVGHAVASKNVVKALACKRNITVVNIHSAKMFMTHGFLSRVFAVFEKHETSIDIVTTSEVNVSLTLDDASAIRAIRPELEEFADVVIENKLAMISIVGEGLGERPGIAARIFRALEGINVRMISQGASLLNVSVVVADSDLEAALGALHKEWFSSPDPEVFA